MGTHRGHNKVFLAVPRTPPSAFVFLLFVRVTLSHPAFTAVTRFQIPSRTPNLIKHLGGRPNSSWYTPRHTEIFPDHRDHLALRRSLGWGQHLRVDMQCHLA
jgi:hypothetical protein